MPHRFSSVPSPALAFVALFAVLAATVTLSAAGCGGSTPVYDSGDAGAAVDAPTGLPEASNGGDAGGSTDAGPTDAGPTDAPTASDTGPALDSGLESGADVYASPIDAGSDAPVDAGEDALATGISWPPGQVFPTFASPGPLDVINESTLDAGTQTLAVTLEGLVNRTRPRIFLNDVANGENFWLSKIGGTQTPVPDPLTLVAKYTTEIAGIVIYDDALADTLNLACTIAGIEGGIVSSPGLAPTLTAAPYSLPVLADLRTNHFATKLDVYNYELANYAPKATNKMIFGLTPAIPDHLRDYAVATKGMMVWLDPTVAVEAALLDQFLALLPPNAPYMGWWTDEPSGVHQASTHGVPVFAADWSINLTVLGGTPRGSTPPQVPPPPPLENKVYIAIFMSDGDNLQEDEGLIPLKWADSARGSVPISWTIDPAVVDVAPVILQYFQSTATVNDLLVSGPSGLGYTYPAAWPSASVFDQYADVSGRYMSAAGLDITTVWNNGADLSAANAQSYVTNVPNLLGLTIQSSTTPRQFVGNGIPIDEMSVSYAATEADLENGIDAVVATFDGTKPVFAAVQGDMNMGTIQPSAFAATQNHYATNTHVEFVRADQYFKLLSRWNGGSAHRTWSGDFNGDGRTDSLFYYAGNGDFWFGLSDGTQLNWSRAANVAVQFPKTFGGFLGASDAFYPGDFNGDGKEDILLYSGSDGNFWLGTSNGTTLTFTNVSASGGFGNLLDGKHSIRIGDYNGDGKTDVGFYSAPDGNWWLGISSGTALTWSGAGNTSGFGDLLDGSHAFYDGDFNGDGKADVLFFYNGDQSLWLGASSGTSLAWSNVGERVGLRQPDRRRAPSRRREVRRRHEAGPPFLLQRGRELVARDLDRDRVQLDARVGHRAGDELPRLEPPHLHIRRDRRRDRRRRDVRQRLGELADRRLERERAHLEHGGDDLELR